MIRDAVVVGAGVVGVATAAALARAGLTVTLVDRQPPPRAPAGSDYDLRVYALSPASMQLLATLGAALPADRVCPYAGMRVWSGSPADALRFAAADVHRRELGWIAEQDQLLWSLWRALGEVETCTGALVQSCTVDAEAARLVLDDGRRLDARLVVAADGADSPLRARAGIDCVGWSYPQQAIVCHLRTALPHDGVALQRFRADGPLAFLPLADGRRSIVWSTRDAPRLLALDDAAFCAALEEAIGGEVGTITQATRRAHFPLRLLHARSYVGERLVLVGDAAHVVHPLAGQGVNLGLADAASLAAVLAAAMAAGRDPGSPRVLERHARARRADTLDMLAVTDALQRLFGLPLPGLGSALDLGLRAVDALPALKQPLIQRALGL